jgi:predicted NAD/FAD-binding protein
MRTTYTFLSAIKKDKDGMPEFEHRIGDETKIVCARMYDTHELNKMESVSVKNKSPELLAIQENNFEFSYIRKGYEKVFKPDLK